MKITSFLARLSGTVTFADGTTSMLHSQCDDTQQWSIDKGQSLEATKQVAWYIKHGDYPYWDGLTNMINSVLTGTDLLFEFDFTQGRPAVQRIINDMVARFEMIFTLNDGTTISTAAILTGANNILTVEIPGGIFTNLPNTPTNAVEITTKLTNMFKWIMDEVLLAPAP